MTVPLLFLIPSSCNKQSNIDHETDIGVVETRTVTEFCENRACEDPIIQPIVGEIYVINGCSITVNYTKEICPLSVSIRNMTYSFANSTACNSYRQIWNQYFMNGQSQLANESINQFYKMLSQMIENKILAGLPNGTYTFHFIETFCHTLCAKEIKDGENPSFFELTQEKCGKSCCVRSTKYVNGTKVTSVIYEGGGCDPIPVDCHGDIHISTICDPACARL
jgi:hypothetical protein